MSTKEQLLDTAENHRLAGNYEAAKEAYNKIISLDQSDDISDVHAIRGLAEVYRMQENFGQATKYYNQAKEQYEKANHYIGVGYACLGLGQLKRHNNELDAAKAFVFESVNALNKTEDSYGHADAKIELGHIFYSQLNYIEAIESFEAALTIYQEVQDGWGMAAASFGVAKIKNINEEYTDAINYSNQALKHYIESNEYKRTIVGYGRKPSLGGKL